MSGWIWTTVCAVSHCLVLFLSWSVGFLNIDIDTVIHKIRVGEGLAAFAIALQFKIH